MQSHAYLHRKRSPSHTIAPLGISVLLGLSMLLAACGPTGSGGNTAPKKGGSVTEVISQEPDSLLPFAAGLTFSVLVDNAIWAPLWYGDNQIPATLYSICVEGFPPQPHTF